MRVDQERAKERMWERETKHTSENEARQWVYNLINLAGKIRSVGLVIIASLVLLSR